jgi:HEAT repeat protein
MRTANKISLTVLSSALAVGLAATTFSGTAQAGRGGSYQAIRSAVAANSIDAIQAELERAENLVCGGCTDVVLPLVDHLDYRVRKVAAWWLARRQASRTVYVAMLTRLSQPDSVKARNAADVLGEFHAGSAIPALGAALSNPIYTGEARAAMARALGQIGRNAAAAPLQQALTDTDPFVKSAALQALREVEGFRNGMVAVPLLSDGDAQVRADAAVTIGVLHTRAGVTALVAAMKDPSADVRKKAAWSLGRLGAPLSVAGPALQNAAANDPDSFVRSVSQTAIASLTR